MVKASFEESTRGPRHAHVEGAWWQSDTTGCVTWSWSQELLDLKGPFCTMGTRLPPQGGHKG